MKVLAINSSARTDGQSKTKLMLDHLVEGMRDAGADVEVVELRKKKINNCIGCFTCWTKTPGVCLHNDDMTTELFPKFLGSDLAVFATPLYHFTVNAQLKTFIERTLPAIEPFFKERHGKTTHPLRGPHPGIVMLSVAGFPEYSVFDQLSAWANFVYGREGGLVAEIYRPLAEALPLAFVNEKAGEILEATRQAGREIVLSLKVSPETMQRITQDIVEDHRAFLRIGDLMWKTCIDQGVTPKEFDEKGMMPRPDSLEDFMAIMNIAFNPGADGNISAVIQYRFTGEVQGECHFRITDGRISSSNGPAEKPDLTISTPFELWMDIMAGKADGQQMFLEQKYTVEGDLNLLMRMSRLFGAQS
ncbi:MAG: NAD(P)H-dependent oxidoreductase [Deltaproteobacteria bacterium]|nr:NAD(P)H-dependent oxidoreductase [Deltaproteobacteria bacterium]